MTHSDQHQTDDKESKPLDTAQIAELSANLEAAWEVVDSTSLQRSFTFPSFMEAMVFVNDVAAIAEDQNHHPTMEINYRSVVVTLTTHECHGLTSRDFALARHIEQCV